MKFGLNLKNIAVSSNVGVTGWIISSQIYYAETLTSSTSECNLEDKIFKEVIKLKTKSVEWALIQRNWCPYKKRELGLRRTEGRPCEAEGDGQGEKPQQKPALWHFDLGSSRVQNCEKLNIYCLKHQVWSTLLCQF